MVEYPIEQAPSNPRAETHAKISVNRMDAERRRWSAEAIDLLIKEARSTRQPPPRKPDQHEAQQVPTPSESTS